MTTTNVELYNTFYESIEKILIYCSTNGLNYNHKSYMDTHIKPSLNKVINTYNDMFMDVFNLNIQSLLINDISDKLLLELSDCIGLPHTIQPENKTYIYTEMRCMLKQAGNIYKEYITPECDTTDKSTDDMYDDMYDGMGLGNCCYCNEYCNPHSQSCGRCARGLSGIAVGLPVPKNLEKFVQQ